MTSLKGLSSEEINTVHEWLRQMGMPVNRTLDRDYSDGVLVAKLLKKLYPRHVDVKGYHPRVNHDLKVINWQMLQFKVFNRIGLPLNYGQIYNLAKGESGLLEPLLWQVMALEKRKETGKKRLTNMKHRKSVELDREVQVPPRKISKDNKRPEKTEASNNKIKGDTLDGSSALSSKFATQKQNQDEEVVDLTEQGMVPFAVYEDVVSEVRAKENTIRAFKTKVSILERLIKERDTEINNLKTKGFFAF